MPVNEKQRIEAVVFDVHTATQTVEVIGIPFEHDGQQFAVHRPAYHSPFNARYVVSHVESGLAIGAVREYTIDDARAAAIAFLSANGAELQHALRRGAKECLARATKVHRSLQ